MIKVTVSKANLITITMKNIVDKLKKKKLVPPKHTSVR